MIKISAGCVAAIAVARNIWWNRKMLRDEDTGASRVKDGWRLVKRKQNRLSWAESDTI